MTKERILIKRRKKIKLTRRIKKIKTTIKIKLIQEEILVWLKSKKTRLITKRE